MSGLKILLLLTQLLGMGLNCYTLSSSYRRKDFWTFGWVAILQIFMASLMAFTIARVS